MIRAPSMGRKSRMGRHEDTTIASDGFLVAIQGNTVVGSVIAGWDGWRGNIYRLAVAPEARRRRLAQRLVREAALVMKSKGGRRLSALVERHEPHAVGFGDHLAADGWRRDERMMRYVRASD